MLAATVASPPAPVLEPLLSAMEPRYQEEEPHALLPGAAADDDGFPGLLLKSRLLLRP